MKLNGSYEHDIKLMENLTAGDPTIKLRDFEGRYNPGIRCRIFFSDGMVSSQLLSDGILEPIINFRGELPKDEVLDYMALAVLELPEVRHSNDSSDMAEALNYGDVLLFAEGQPGALIIGCKNFTYRGISEPEEEKVARGPREGFTEPIMINISMLKRRLRTHKLRIDMVTVGDRTSTACGVISLDGVTDEKLVKHVKELVEKIKIDGILSSNYISELIDPAPFGFFRRIGSTARPDVAAAKLLEGRVLIMVDGSPQVLTLPFVFLEHFQSPEDYYVTWHHAAFSRALRMAAFALSITLVPVYVAVLNYHPGTFPTMMIMNIVALQQATPFSALTESVLLLIAFDLLREAGLRTPASVGQTLSIVGALILGQSAVEANIVSPSMLIVVALSGVTGLIINDLRNQVVLIRFMLLALGAAAGLWGIAAGMTIVLGRMAEIGSFGADYLTGMPLNAQGSHEDSLFRTPISMMKKSGRFMAQRDRY
ncbi:MAG: spore germination protein [Clostridia bacterium]|nr:spore germination protein [Clostridia bacterium]